MNQIIETMIEQVNQKPKNEPLRLLTALQADHMAYSNTEKSLKFKVKGDRKDINTVVVKYDEGIDLYDIEFHMCKILRKYPYIINEKRDEIKGVYFDQLTDLIWKRCVIV